MSIQSPEVAAEVINAWFARHSELVNDDHNANVLGAWIQKNHDVCGQLVFTDFSLETAYQVLAASGQLHFYASPETQRQIAAGAAAQAQLNAERQEKQRQGEIARKQLERDARQAALPGPGMASAMAGMEDEALKAAQARKAMQDNAAAKKQFAQFRRELHEANNLLECMSDGSGRISYSKTESARNAARENLKRKYPVFAHLVIPNPA